MMSLPPGLRCHHAGSLDDPDFNNVHLEIASEDGGFNRKDFKSANDANLHKFLTAECFNRKELKELKWQKLKMRFWPQMDTDAHRLIKASQISSADLESNSQPSIRAYGLMPTDDE